MGDGGIKMIMGGIAGSIEKMFGINPDRKDSIMAHYGVEEDKLDVWTKEMAIDIIHSKSKSEVLDKWFKSLDGEGRVKVLAYAHAHILLDKMSRANK